MSLQHFLFLWYPSQSLSPEPTCVNTASLLATLQHSDRAALRVPRIRKGRSCQWMTLTLVDDSHPASAMARFCEVRASAKGEVARSHFQLSIFHFSPPTSVSHPDPASATARLCEFRASAKGEVARANLEDGFASIRHISPSAISTTQGDLRAKWPRAPSDRRR